MRPRRFGKTLNMSMLRSFFENTGDKELNEKKAGLFAGTKIMDQGNEYLCHMNAYPTITLTLKSMKQPTWELAYNCIKDEIRKEFKRHRSVIKSLDLEEDKRRYNTIMNLKGWNIAAKKSSHKYMKNDMMIGFRRRDIPKHGSKGLLFFGNSA